MVEAALNAAATATITHQLTGEVPGRLGNRSATGSVPRGVYPCAGTDQWVAVEVENDRQWAQLCGVVGRPPSIGADHDGLAGADLGSTRHDKPIWRNSTGG